jgi:ABC-2 type transport system ATP-binding protein
MTQPDGTAFASTTDPPVIIAEDLHKSFGETNAVCGLSFSVASGTILGLLGPNGAGKTTAINMLTTLLDIDRGSASVDGFDVATQADQVRQVIGLAGQSAAVDDLLTARQNLTLFGRLYKIPKNALERRVDDLIDRFEMNEFADRVAGTYSGGQRRRLDVVASLVAAPPALFLDEPTTGLDPRSRAGLWSEIRSLAANGTAIVLTTQYLDEADRLADEIVIIDRGTTVASGSAAELKRDLERDVLEVHFASPPDVDAAIQVLTDAAGECKAGRERNMLTIPVRDGSRSSLDVLRRLDGAGIPLLDFQLRRPTLDDVFLTITEGEEPLEERNAG